MRKKNRIWIFTIRNFWWRNVWAIFSLEYLLQHPKAWSRYQFDVESGVGKIAWGECNVIGHDPKTSLFTIEWNDDKKQKQVVRFNLKFDIEEDDLFDVGIEEAERSSRDYEMQFSLNCRVGSIPTDDSLNYLTKIWIALIKFLKWGARMRLFNWTSERRD